LVRKIVDFQLKQPAHELMTGIKRPTLIADVAFRAAISIAFKSACCENMTAQRFTAMACFPE
jgi:hypothetical protein